MFTDRVFGKRRAKRQQSATPATAPTEAQEPSLQASAPPAPPVGDDAAAIVRAGASTAGGTGAAGAAGLEGLTLEDYARLHEMTEAEVWRRLRRGELIGRTQRGRLTVFSSPEAAARAENDLTAMSPPRRAGAESPRERGPSVAEAARAAAGADERELHDLHERLASAEPPLPPLPPDVTADGRSGASAGTGPYLALTGERAQTPEMALLLDHLSLAKEENREILRMTQESIRKVTELTDSIVEMKDAVIGAKDAQIQAMQSQLDAFERQIGERERQIKTLLQQQEDLEMLARTMASDALATKTQR